MSVNQVYLDAGYACHAAQDAASSRTPAEHPFFEGMCPALVACYRYLPPGARWARADGAVFEGEMLAPHTDTAPAEAAQRDFERALARAAQAAGIAPAPPAAPIPADEARAAAHTP